MPDRHSINFTNIFTAVAALAATSFNYSYTATNNLSAKKATEAEEEYGGLDNIAVAAAVLFLLLIEPQLHYLI